MKSPILEEIGQSPTILRQEMIMENVLKIFFLVSGADSLWVSSDPRELELDDVRCLATYEIDNLANQPARDVMVKLLESYTKDPASKPGEFPDYRDVMPGYHMAELLAVVFAMGAEWAHDNPDDPSGHAFDISA